MTSSYEFISDTTGFFFLSFIFVWMHNVLWKQSSNIVPLIPPWFSMEINLSCISFHWNAIDEEYSGCFEWLKHTIDDKIYIRKVKMSENQIRILKDLNENHRNLIAIILPPPKPNPIQNIDFMVLQYRAMHESQSFHFYNNNYEPVVLYHSWRHYCVWFYILILFVPKETYLYAFFQHHIYVCVYLKYWSII